MTKKTENTVVDVVFPDFAAIEWIAHAPAIKVGGNVVIVSDELAEEEAAAAAAAAEAENTAAENAKKTEE